MGKAPYDYCIVGAGAAGLQLALALQQDTFFSSKKILILDPDPKTANDRTWSFWEQGEGLWDHLAWKTWEKARFISPGLEKSYDLLPYRYKTLRSADFYRYATEKIQKDERFTWLKERVEEVQGHHPVTILTDTGTRYTADFVFDSRLPPEFKTGEDEYCRVWQHFKGWVIETEKDCFDPAEFTMMDFRFRWKDRCSFIYVLPESSRRALVEFTFFSPVLEEQAVYDEMLLRYIRDFLDTGPYHLVEQEYGVIPMTDFPFHRYSREGLMKIGTAGSWVKPSSGYSFSNAGRFTKIILENLRNGRKPHKGILSGRHRKYDTLFLEILRSKNELGPQLFEEMYRNNSIQSIFRFLDEDTTPLEELKIISSFSAGPFLDALARKTFGMRR